MFFYKNYFTPETPPMTSSDCMAVGALAGVVGAIFGTMLGSAFLALFGNVTGDMLMGIIRNMDLNLPDDALDNMENSLREGVTVAKLAVQLVGSLIIDSIFGMIGGLIGFSVFKPKNQYAVPPMQPPNM